MMKKLNSIFFVARLPCVVFTIGLMVGVSSLECRQGFAFQMIPQVQIRIGMGGLGDLASMGSEDTEVEFEAGAVLKTDPDLEGVLEKAERFRADGNYRVACQLWQAVLQRSGDSLYSSDGSNYFSLVQQVEKIIASLPQEGLDAYRVLADGEAKEILAEADSESDEVALNRIVRQYFLSSLGDDAAFNLGCVYLDRFDFIGARRMFEKVVGQYPDPSVPLEEVYSRVALCQSYLGEVDAAKATLVIVEKIKAETELADLVRRSLGELSASGNRSSFDANWLMPMGDPRRYGVTAGVPKEMMEQDLAAIWQFYYEPKDKYVRAADTDGIMLTGEKAYGPSVLDTRISLEERMIESWREKGWRPAGHLLIDDNNIFFKTGSDVSVWDSEKVLAASRFSTAQADLSKAISWRSVWKNAFQMDEATKMMMMIRKSYGAFNRRGGSQTAVSSPMPMTDTEVQLFGDEIFQQMSIYKGQLFSLEGKPFSHDGKNRTVSKRVTPQWNATYRRSRINALTCYDAKTGMVQWSLPREITDEETPAPEGGNDAKDEDPNVISGGGCMAAPIGFADMILVPFNVGGAISIYALDPKQGGKTIWKSFLCDEPESGAVPWSSIDLTIEGSDLFVNCGMGVIFVLDPSTGLVRFAKRYKRVGRPDDFQRRNNWTVNRLNFSGWSSDLVVPYGRQMICFCSDTNLIEAYDRNTGKTIWRTEMSPMDYKIDYLLGVYEGILYAAGSETVIAYDLEGTGRAIWGMEQIFDGKQSLGRGILTPQGIYLPVEDSIYLLGLKGKKVDGEMVPHVIAKVHVDLGTNAPVGNLFSDGKRFWVHGANRIYALGPRKD